MKWNNGVNTRSVKYCKINVSYATPPFVSSLRKKKKMDQAGKGEMAHGTAFR